MYEESEKGGAKRDRNVLCMNTSGIVSAAGAPCANSEAPPHVRGARAKAATCSDVSFHRLRFEGMATAK